MDFGGRLKFYIRHFWNNWSNFRGWEMKNISFSHAKLAVHMQYL